MPIDERNPLLARLQQQSNTRKGSILYGTLIGKRNRHQYSSFDGYDRNLFLSAAAAYASDSNIFGNSKSNLFTAAGNNDRRDGNDGDEEYDNDEPSSIRIKQTIYGTSSIYAKTLGQTRKENIWFAFYIFLYIGYLCIGSIFFEMSEVNIEQNFRESYRNSKNFFLAKYPQVQDEDLEEFLVEVVKANDRGISPLRNASAELNWGFGQALFFASTVVTTIGYGRVTPLSQTGKIFCMIYATIGIPLTLVLLTAVVERLLLPANWLLGKLNSKLGHLYQPFNIRLMHLSIIIAIIAILFFMIPTAVFAYLEPTWGVLDAFYYCFISLTTIGLGDYIPGDGVSPEHRSLYKICITIYLICGLIAMMLALTVFYDIPQLNLGQLFTENSTGDSEKLRLSGSSAPCYSGPSGLYIPQRDEEVRRAVVRIRPHGDESPSPDEPPPSLTTTTTHKDVIP